MCLGLTKANEWEERDIHMRSQYVDPIEGFPAKMDQLLEALNKVGPGPTEGGPPIGLHLSFRSMSISNLRNFASKSSMDAVVI